MELGFARQVVDFVELNFRSRQLMPMLVQDGPEFLQLEVDFVPQEAGLVLLSTLLEADSTQLVDDST